MLLLNERATELEMFDLSENSRAFFEVLPIPLVLSGIEGKLEYVNPALTALLGYQGDEVYANDVIITHPDDWEINRRVRASLIAQPFQPVVAEKRYLTKDGRAIPAMLTMVAQPDANGLVRRFIAQIVDLSESKRIAAARQKAEQRFRAMFENAPVGMALCDSLTGAVYDANASYLKIAGRKLSEVQGLGWMSITHPDDLERNLEQVGRLVRGEVSSFRMTKRLLKPDNSLVFVQLSCTAIDVGEVKGGFHHLAMLEDVTEFRQAQQELLNAAMVYQKSSESMMILAADGTVVAVNAAFVSRTGYSEDELRGKVPGVLDSGQYDQSFYLSLWHTVKEKDSWQGEIWSRGKSGEVFPEWVSVNAVRGHSGDLHRLICLSSDMTEKKAAEKLIWQQANFDSLTGLPNRSMLRDRLRLELSKAERAGLQVALFNLDLDGFKDVNDSLGHEVGDQLLVEAARRLSACVRSVDTVARQGGDEFIIVMGGLKDTESVDRVADEVLDALCAPFQLGAEVVNISTSIGLALYPRDGVDISALVRNADQAMYAAKRQGRNCFQYYTEAMQRAAMARRQLIDDLREALQGRQLLLYFQPVVCLSTGSVSSVEALLRWRHPQRGIVCPTEFIAIAEETGMIMELGRWVFKEALDQVKRLRRSCSAQFRVSINTSPLQYSDRSYNADQWRSYMRRCDLPADALSVEISESMLRTERPDIESKLAVLRETGVRVTLDDFGTGNVALASLNRFGVDYLKIDSSIVANVQENSSEHVLCQAIVAMAHKMGIKVIAEGVERELQHRLLQAAGCDMAQGYWYARPAPVDEFERWYLSGNARTRLLRAAESPVDVELTPGADRNSAE